MGGRGHTGGATGKRKQSDRDHSGQRERQTGLGSTDRVSIFLLLVQIRNIYTYINMVIDSYKLIYTYIYILVHPVNDDK